MVFTMIFVTLTIILGTAAGSAAAYLGSKFILDYFGIGMDTQRRIKMTLYFCVLPLSWPVAIFVGGGFGGAIAGRIAENARLSEPLLIPIGIGLGLAVGLATLALCVLLVIITALRVILSIKNH